MVLVAFTFLVKTVHYLSPTGQKQNLDFRRPPFYYIDERTGSMKYSPSREARLLNVSPESYATRRFITLFGSDGDGHEENVR
jgi:hypothetical protein